MSSSAHRRLLSRRTFLRLTGLTTVGTVLAACGFPAAAVRVRPTTSTPTLTPTRTPTRTSTPAPTGTATSTPSPTPTATHTPAHTPTFTPSPVPSVTSTPTPTVTRGPLQVISLIHGPARSLVVDHVLQRFGVLATTVRVDLGEPVPDLRDYDAVIFAGGEYRPEEFEEPIFEAERERILAALASGVPILGICLGHQLLAHWLGGEVKRGSWEMGWLPIVVNGAGRADPLLSGLGESFYAFLWHGDQVTRLPREAALLASSERCPVQVYRLRDLPVWGVQFNPQYDPAIAEGVIRGSSWLPTQGYDIEELVAIGYREYQDVAGRIFGNFLQYVAQGEGVHAAPGVLRTPGVPADGVLPR